MMIRVDETVRDRLNALVFARKSTQGGVVADLINKAFEARPGLAVLMEEQAAYGREAAKEALYQQSLVEEEGGPAGALMTDMMYEDYERDKAAAAAGAATAKK